MEYEKDTEGTVIKGAIFDMDGTLLDSMPVWEHACENYLSQRGLQAKEGLSELLFTMSMREGAAYVKEAYGLTEDVEELVAGVNGVIYTAYERQVEPKEGVRGFLEEMEREGIPMTVATATDREMAEMALRRTGLDHYFSRIFTCSEVGAGKTKPDIYLAAAEYLGAAPRELWVFEDALYALKTAKDAGFRTVGLYDASRERTQEQLRADADIYAENLCGFSELYEKIKKLTCE